MRRNGPRRRRGDKGGRLVAVARTDSVNLAKYYGRLLGEKGIETAIRAGDETTGLFNISILVSEELYDEAYLFIESENSYEAHYLDSMFEAPEIRRQTG